MTVERCPGWTWVSSTSPPAAAAAARYVAATIRSGMTVWRTSRVGLRPWMQMVELPAPFTWHPMAHRKSWRSPISGSRAALRSTVSP